MKYIVVTPNSNTAEEQAEILSRELYKISRPSPNDKDETKYLFAWHIKGDEAVLQITEDYDLPVGKNVSLAKLVNALPNVSDTEKNMLASYIQSKDRVRFGSIIPSTVTVKTREELEAEGWFAQEP